MPPPAALGTMAYGPATGAVAAAPMLVSVTLPTVSPFFVPAYVNADSTGVWPYTLLALVAVTVSAAGVMLAAVEALALTV